MTDNRKAMAVTVTFIVILFLLVWRSKAAGNTIINQSSAPPILVSAPIEQFSLPAIVKRGGAWDWMQTTDLSCGCDVGLWKEPILIGPSVAPATSYPVYKYIVTNNYSGGNNVSPAFAQFVTPQLPTFHFENGINVQGEYRTYAVTEFGEVMLGGKYSRHADNYGTYPMQTKTFELNGPDLFVDGKHYKYDRSKDDTNRKLTFSFAGSSIASN
jgi:hypothetical protein